MRIDLALKHLCIVKSRSIAKALCDGRLVLLEGKPARPSTPVAAGNRVTVHFSRHTVSLVLLTVPEKQLSKSAAVDYYQRVETPSEDKRPEGGSEALDDFFDPR